MRIIVSSFICFFSFSVFAGFLDNFAGTQSVATLGNTQSAIGVSSAPSSSGVGKGISRKATSVFGYDPNEVLDYNTQKIGSFDIKPLEHGIQLKTKLTVEQYQILIKDWLNNIYENKFDSKAWVLMYFVRALAEMTFSNDGYFSTVNFNSVLTGFENYRKIDTCISKLGVSSAVKYSLAKLFAAGCVYTRYVDNAFAAEATDVIKKIPKGVVLYHMEEQAENLRQEGKITDEKLENFIGYDHGENLYYICASYYDNFKDLPKDKQIKIINQVYSYNPTLMEAPPIKRKMYFWNYLMDYFYPEKNPEVMKYCVRGYVNWVLLPKSI